MPPATPEDVTTFFAQDHRRIDLALARFQQESDADAARIRLDEFERMLLRHIRWEEDALFPAFEEKLGAQALGCTGGMRSQHEELKLRVAELRQSLTQAGRERRNVEDVLIEALSDHNHAEEDFIYPWMDGAFTREERRRLLDKLD